MSLPTKWSRLGTRKWRIIRAVKAGATKLPCKPPKGYHVRGR